MRILVSCPPFIRSIEHLSGVFTKHGVEYECAKVTQVLTETELMELLPQFDGWVIGDDPATRRVFEAGVKGKLKAAVKFGVGIDNVDFQACRDLGIPIANTPGMFGHEVADIALGYVIALARETFSIDRGVKAGKWPKPVGMSLAGKTVALVGFGDIGRQTAIRLRACNMQVIAYDPFYKPVPGLESIVSETWPSRLDEADFVVVTCALTESNRNLLNAKTLPLCKKGVRIVNVSRGPLIDEHALADALAAGQVTSAALEVFEVEPLPIDSPLRQFEQCLFGSHNASNSQEAVVRTGERAVLLLLGFLGVIPPVSP